VRGQTHRMSLCDYSSFQTCACSSPTLFICSQVNSGSSLPKCP
jgi:hypothetical protein